MVIDLRIWDSPGLQPLIGKGFQRLVTEVSLGRAGIVLGLEVSPLARNSMDWHRLLGSDLRARRDTPDPRRGWRLRSSSFQNDRLRASDLKGTLSEAELHVLRARLQGGTS